MKISAKRVREIERAMVMDLHEFHGLIAERLEQLREYEPVNVETGIYSDASVELQQDGHSILISQKDLSRVVKELQESLDSHEAVRKNRKGKKR